MRTDMEQIPWQLLKRNV